MTPYAIIDCPRARYDAIEAINQSALKRFAQSAEHFHYAATAPKPDPTDAMILGCLVEHFVFGTPYAWVRSKFPAYRTDESKVWKKEQHAAGLEIISDTVHAKARAMANKVLANRQFNKWMPFRVNIALVGIHEPTGLAMKGLVDFAPDADLLIGDHKTSADASLRGFGRSIVDFGYDCQAAVYTELWRQCFNEERQFGFLIVESEEPFCTSTQILRSENSRRAWVQCERWLTQYRHCLDTDTWPGYSQELEYAEVPEWRFRDL